MKADEDDEEGLGSGSVRRKRDMRSERREVIEVRKNRAGKGGNWWKRVGSLVVTVLSCVR